VLLFHDTHHRAASDPAYFTRLDLSGFDGVLAYGRSLARLYEAKTDRVWVWHEAADVRRFRPLPYQGERRDLVWIGNWGDDERTREIFEFFIEPARQLRLSATVYGVRYPEAAQRALSDAAIHYGGWLPNYRVPEIFAQFRCTVHIPRNPYVRQLPGIPTIRPFEALACGIPLVSAPWPDDEGLFSPGKDYLVAADGGEMIAQLQELRRSKTLAEALRQHGLKTIQQRHTCEHRVNELLGIITDAQGRKRLRKSAQPTFP
jgi:spore maturation protein CgeB